MMKKTPAEQCRDEGRAEGEARGRAEGEAKGCAKTLLKLMQLKFGSVPDEVTSAITSASLEQLERWTERVLSADSAAQIVAED
jgi:predicted transposase YdaD